jgi:hypothetical protein
MIKIRATIVISVLMAIGSASIIFSSCRKKSMDGMIIFTRVPGKVQNINFITGDSWRYLSQAQIVALDPDKPEGSLKVLSGDYFSARSPEISYDGKFLLFAAQQKQNDVWQIWEMDLNNLKTRQLTKSKENCTDPVYLPGGRMLFSKLSTNDTLRSGHSLYTCNLDGSNLRRITFNPHTYFGSNVLSDGRVLTIGRELFPNQGDQRLIVLRPDGTKAELFYEGTEGSNLIGPGLETDYGRLVFIESDKDNPEAGQMISISYNRPLHSRVNLTSGVKGDFHAVCPMHSGKLLVSYRKSESDRYALCEFDPDNKAPGKIIYNNAEFDVMEMIECGKHNRPKKLPSEVDLGVKTGLLMCQDINVLNTLRGGSPSVPKSSRIEIVGIDSTLGSVDVAEDGSFYLKVMADKPFKIRTVDKDGHVMRSPCGWIWLRPNERRGCVGCHEDQELVPGNRVSLAVKKSPVVIPMHINKVVEKKVSLE